MRGLVGLACERVDAIASRKGAAVRAREVSSPAGCQYDRT